ncbi:5'-methylthioadenosine/S-adenosylhomocysteine nucleosidase family protein [Calycomorphotria hydatis]|uniref:5'-methylthioadenosine/S-adenosylhomocysteine nucleosidase n=1 Tax=Calycomorphotria hydatis TaxID=2528027 RepID=A0A517T7G2_9PLAN|nr:hypothetical protein [Calycomorphotria hydatis]QDT64309.1 5'-methylthioadenosine/S-adenosylhomocysteine nucleosidase [Calycomorphotria hydatis]
MIVNWRETLKTLQLQFQSRAAEFGGLYHLMVEVADNEREKLYGPPWFKPFDGHPEIVAGKPQFKKWDCSQSSGLPGIAPGFREFLPSDENLDSKHVICDLEGTPRAVSTPMRLRRGFLCGQSDGELENFESLANSAAKTLADAEELDKHPFAADLTDIFRKPRGLVRYVFGEINTAPSHPINKGWSAGIIQFKHGVLIDVPISESSPDASHWLLFLHRLGWRGIRGCPLVASRTAWDDHFEVRVELLGSENANAPVELQQRLNAISKESYYSVLGTKEAPIDVNLASVFAIQAIVSGLSTETKSELSNESDKYYADRLPKVAVPRIRSVDFDEIRKTFTPKIGVLVATETERKAVLTRMKPRRNGRALIQVFKGSNTHYLGRLGVEDVVVCMSAAGSVGRDASTIVTTELIEDWNLNAVLMLGIAFGRDSSKQRLRTVLISDRVIAYEPERIGKNSSRDRGAETQAGSLLLNRCRNTIGWHFDELVGTQCGFQVGPLLSGEKLVDNVDYKASLFERYPDAIGGEMEGAGVAAAAERKKIEWIIIKSICDWGDGTKSDDFQKFAAAVSVDFVTHLLSQPGSLDSL